MTLGILHKFEIVSKIKVYAFICDFRFDLSYCKKQIENNVTRLEVLIYFYQLCDI